MSTVHDRLMRLGKRTQIQATTEGFDPYVVLRGLSPSLVITLARMAGSSLTDLTLTFQLLTWGDRAALAAYGIVSGTGRTDGKGQPLRALPPALELVSAAAEVTASVADPRDVSAWLVAHRGEDAAEEPPTVSVERRDSRMLTPVQVLGRVASVIADASANGSILTIDVYPDADSFSISVVNSIDKISRTWQVKTRERLEIARFSDIVLYLQQIDTDTFRPIAISPGSPDL